MPCRVFAALIAMSIFLGACGGNPSTPFSQRVDEQSGESFTQVREPIRLVAIRPALSRVGKDYLFVAPVLVSGSRDPQKYLWFSFGSSIDRHITGARVTASQLRRLSTTSKLSAFVTNNNYRSPEYVLAAGEYEAWAEL